MDNEPPYEMTTSLLIWGKTASFYTNTYYLWAQTTLMCSVMLVILKNTDLFERQHSRERESETASIHWLTP